jgi:hypothetical protein
VRELVEGLHGKDLDEMLWVQLYTKAESNKQQKFLKHLLNKGDPQAAGPR